MGDVYHRKTMRLTGYDYNTPGAYFLTICTKDRQCLLAHIKEGDVVNGPVHTLKPYGQTVKSYIEKMDALYDYLKVENYVIIMLKMTKGFLESTRKMVDCLMQEIED